MPVMSSMWVGVLSWVAPVQAEGTMLWLQGTPNPSVDPGFRHLGVGDVLAETRWTEADERAIVQLRAELDAVRPMLEVFDGELQIMRRLETAIENVTVLRPEDRDLMYRALLFQGLAVRRYFQDGLPVEEGAAPYRVQIEGRTEVRPWVDAVALDPDRQATTADLPEEPELLLFQEARARHLLTQNGLIRTEDPLPSGGRLVVNGVPATVDRMRVLSGTHRITIEVEGEIRARLVGRVEGAAPLTIPLRATMSDLPGLVAQLVESRVTVVALPPPLLSSLSTLSAPVQLVAEDERGRRYRYQVEGSSAIRVEDDAAAKASAAGLSWRAAVGGGWVYDGDYLLQNAVAGAPSSRATVNAGSPVVSGGLEYGLGASVVGVGVDALLPLGEWHSLPSGETGTEVRARLYPHLSAGLPWLRLTGGLMFPWHVGVGPRAHLTLQDDLGLQLTGAWTYGLGLPLSYETGETFTPDRFQTGWVALGVRR